MSVPAGAKIPLVIVGADDVIRERVDRNDETLKRLARIDEIDFAGCCSKRRGVDRRR